MTDVQPNGADAPSVTIPAPPPPAENRPISVREAANGMAEWRAKQAAAAEKSQTPREPNGRFAAAQTESTPSGEDAAPPQEATGETEGIDPAETPPLDRPRSWSKDRDEHWKTLDRATQEILLEHDRSASDAVRKAQNEAAEQRKAIEADRTAAQQARQHYEQAAQRTLSVLQSEMNKDFGDIKSLADVQKLANEDPFRFAQFQARQMQLQAHQSEVDQLQRKTAEDKATQFKAWSKEQDDKFEQSFPEFADKAKADTIRKGITGYLTEKVGVPAEALPRLWESDLFRDAMFQRVVYDAYRFNSASEKAKAAVQVPKPQVQRPGVAASKGSQHQEAVEAAQARLKSAKGVSAVEAAADLMRARRAAQR